MAAVVVDSCVFSNALNDAIFIIRRLKKLNTMTAKELEDLEYNVRSRYVRND